MGRIAKILSFVRSVIHGAKVSDVKVDPGGGANITAQHFAPAGDDSFPLTTDYVYIGNVPRQGNGVALGYIDPINEPKALEGGKRIYARDPSDGSVIAEVWLKNDGTVVTSNENGSYELKPDGSQKGDNGSGSFELQAGGNFVVNGVTIDTAGNITTAATITGATVAATSSLTVAGTTMEDHTHNQPNDGAGDVQQPTGAPN